MRGGDEAGTASYQLFIYKYGYFGLILIMIYFLLLLKKKLILFDTISILVSIIFILYTRPYITSFYFLFIFILGINKYSELYKLKK
jgi:hypothetical protein